MSQTSTAAGRKDAVEAAEAAVGPARGEASPRATLVFAGQCFDDLRSMLLKDAPLESAAFVLARPVRTPAGGWRLIEYDTLFVEHTEYAVRSDLRVDVTPEVVARVMQRARAERAAIVVVHTHTFAGPIQPSPRDREGEAPLLDAFRRRVPEVPHARLIIGLDAAHAALFDVDGAERPLMVCSVGATLRFEVLAHVGPSEAGASAGTPPSSIDDVHDRQVRAFGAHGQQRLALLRVGIVGVGGTGSVVTQQLAHLGVTDFVLVDRDHVELTNLNRVVGARRSDVGRPKVEVARNMIMAINPAASVAFVDGDVCDAKTARALLDCDLFVACTDSQGSRAVLSQLAYQYVLPGIDVGVAISVGEDGVSHVSGRVQMLAPGLACLSCSAVLDPEAVRRDLLNDVARAADPYVMGASRPVAQPAVISINSTASSLAVTMLLSAVSGVPFAARHVRLRLESGRIAPVAVDGDPNCPVCSRVGYLQRGDQWRGPGRLGPVAGPDAAPASTANARGSTEAAT